MLPHERTGVYLIRNVLDGTIYVGSTTMSFGVRCLGHFNALRAGKHNNRHLQFAFKKYGEHAFIFIIWEFVEGTEQIIAREQYWMDYYREHGKVYNILPRAGTTKGQIARVRTQEEREKLRRAATGRKPTPEETAKRKAYWTPERRAEQSARKKGSKIQDTSNYSRARLGNKNARGNSQPIVGGFIAPDGTHYTEAEIGNLADFCRKHDLIPSNMRAVYRGDVPHHKGWKKA